MRRDIHLIQIILEKAADTGRRRLVDFPFPAHEEYEPAVVDEHVRLCEEDGLILAKYLQGGGGFLYHLTSKGHDYLEALDSIGNSGPIRPMGFRKAN